MRIAIDARELTGRATGVGRYLSRLLEQWRVAGAGHEFILYTHRALEGPLAAGFPVRVLEGGGGTLWEQVTLARAVNGDRPAVLFSPAYTAPLLSHVPTVVTIHDVSFVAHPEWFAQREGTRRRFVTRHSAAAARIVITVSEFSRTEIAERLGIDRQKIRVVLHGIDQPTLPIERTGPPAARVLYVGSIFNRRRVPDLIAAVALLAQAHPEVSLDLVGDNRSFPRLDIAGLIDRQTPPAAIRWHRYVSDAELQTLYRQARAFAFLSEYEGFGLTPLEALSRGVPGVLLDTPIAHESCGQSALYVAAGDVEGVADALRSLLFDETVRGRLRAAAPAVLARYDWATAARQTLLALEEAS